MLTKKNKPKETKRRKIVSDNLNGTFDKGVDYSQANERFIKDINILLNQEQNLLSYAHAATAACNAGRRSSQRSDCLDVRNQVRWL